MAKRKWAFVQEGATSIQGGHYSGPRVGGTFHVHYVTGGDGVKFMRSPYSPHGWKVEKNRTKYESQISESKVQFNVTNEEDLAALDAFVGVERYKGWGQYE